MKPTDRGAEARTPRRRAAPAWTPAWVHVAVTAAVIVVGLTSILPHLQAAVDERELRAREAFAVGRYQEALDLFAKLYAEKPHPNYQRNIGRCYQNLGDPDRAINSFRDYLRKAKSLPPEERAEVEGYIKEMEELKARQSQPPAAGAAGGAVSPALAKPATPTQLSPPPGPPSPGGTQAPALATSSAPGADLTNDSDGSRPEDETHPIYKRWWFWAVIGGVAAAGIGIAAASGAFTNTEEPNCPATLPGSPIAVSSCR